MIDNKINIFLKILITLIDNKTKINENEIN